MLGTRLDVTSSIVVQDVIFVTLGLFFLFVNVVMSDYSTYAYTYTYMYSTEIENCRIIDASTLTGFLLWGKSGDPGEGAREQQ